MNFDDKDHWEAEAGFDFELDEQDDEYDPPKNKRLFLALIAFIILITFITWSFPHMGIFFHDLSFLKQNQQLKNEEIVQNSLPAIVSIEARGEGNIASKGTGFNINEEGTILTNYHVVEKSSNIKIVFPDGQFFHIDDYTQISNADIALLKIHHQGLPYLPLDLQEEVKPGDLATVIGNPLGYRQVAVQGNIFAEYYFDDYRIFDIDAPIRKGNSGSPVLNEKGSVVGIIFAHKDFDLEGKTQSRALAIPLNLFSEHIETEIQ